MWDKRLTEIFCDICIKEILKGNRPGTHFTRDGWLKIMTNFEKETGKSFSQRQLKNRWDALKKEWKARKKLKGEDTGLGWNPIKRTVDASDKWWESRLQVVPEAKNFRTSGIDPEFKWKLDQMFMGIADSMSQATSSLTPVMDPFGIPQAVKMLDSMLEEVPEASSLYFFALRLLLNKDKRIMFLSINPKIRALWLKTEMEDSAIDGTHIAAILPPDEKIPYIGRKGIPTQNVMAVCDFNMCFTFVMARWEGSAHDTRIFLDAIPDPKYKFPHPPNGKYHLVDSGYPQMKGYLGPYRGQRYHLPDFRRGRSISDFMEYEDINWAYENNIDSENAHGRESDDDDDDDDDNDDDGESNNFSGFEMELTRDAIASSLMNSL
ncbi:hypothetical protein GOBAR_DD07267 [Gossypium barbadense]|nr:hypothetical protein GOBAR_DD07267 [Gossypium barbadense]